MPRLEKMSMRTGKALVGVPATSDQMREASGSWNLPATMIWWWQILLAPTKHPEKSRGTVQMGKPTIRLIASWWRNDSVLVWTSPRPAAFREQTLEEITSLLRWPSSYIYRGPRNKDMQGSDLTWISWRTHMSQKSSKQWLKENLQPSPY